MSEGHKFDNAAAALAFLVAGNATVTAVSLRTGNRFTFKARKPEDERANTNPTRFVSLLNGHDNESSYQYLGFMRELSGRWEYTHGRKSKVAPGAPSARAFLWMFKSLGDGCIPPELEVWHEGQCGRCGRPLTVPSSIASGFGPECAKKGAMAA